MRQELSRRRIRSQRGGVEQARRLHRSRVDREERLQRLRVEEGRLHDASAGHGRRGRCGDVRLRRRRATYNEKGGERRGPQTDHAI